MAPPESCDGDESVIRSRRILKVLDETIKKIELALCLPIFLNNLDRFSNYLSEEEFAVLSKGEVYKNHNLQENDADYVYNTGSENEYNEKEIKVTPSSESLIKLSQPTITEKERQHSAVEYETPAKNVAEDVNVKKTFDLMWKRPDLADVAKSEYLKFDLNSPGFLFLESMHALRQCLCIRMTEDHSSEAEKGKILYYREIWYENDEATAKINTLKPILNNMMTRIRLELQGKDKLISEMKRRMKNFEIKFQDEMEKICADSEKNMVVDSKGSDVRQAVIYHDINILDEKFQNILKGHLQREKELRVKRYKTESQFEACLETYDNDMGERQAEFDQILAEYKDEQQEMTTLQEKFDEQEKEYTVLMEEKAYEDHLELERHIEDLRRRVAARIIQTYWWALKKRRLERAKSKRSKKGKKKKGRKKRNPSRKSKSLQKKKGGNKKKAKGSGKKT